MKKRCVVFMVVLLVAVGAWGVFLDGSWVSGGKVRIPQVAKGRLVAPGDSAVVEIQYECRNCMLVFQVFLDEGETCWNEHLTDKRYVLERYKFHKKAHGYFADVKRKSSCNNYIETIKCPDCKAIRLNEVLRRRIKKGEELEAKRNIEDAETIPDDATLTISADPTTPTITSGQLTSGALFTFTRPIGVNITSDSYPWVQEWAIAKKSAYKLCPVCKRDGLKSTITLTPRMTVTLLPLTLSYGEEGEGLATDPNIYTSEYKCSRGHEWVEKSCGEKNEIIIDGRTTTLSSDFEETRAYGGDINLGDVQFLGIKKKEPPRR